MNKLLLPSLFAAALFGFAACNSSEHASAIRPPFEKLNVAANYFDVDAGSGGTFSLENGTRIIVPANAFANASGEKISGKVKLRYREFHTPADVIAGGIPMSYDSAGVQHQFVSAGMFELLASSDGENLQLAEGKTVEVQMASFREDATYNFYQLDTNSSTWSYRGTAEPIDNEVKLQRMAKAGIPVRPARPRQAGKTEDVFKFEVDYTAFPELKLFEKVLWKYKGEAGANDPLKNEWIFTEKWRQISIARKAASRKIYTIDLKSRKRSFSMEVEPTFDAADMATAMADFEKNMLAYDKMISDRAATDGWLASQADILRSYKMASLGVCNWDRISNMIMAGKLNTLKADFVIAGVDKEEERLSIYLVDETEGSVRALPREGWEKFYYDPTHVNKIIAVLPDGKTATFASKNFSQIDKQEAFTFRLDKVETEINSIAALNDVLKRS